MSKEIIILLYWKKNIIFYDGVIFEYLILEEDQST